MTDNGNGNGASLTVKQRMFVEAYLANGFNATDAARQAGYAGTDATLAVVGAENIRKPKIRTLINERLDAATMTAEEALAKEDEIARFDISPYLNTAGRVVFLDVDLMIADGYGHMIRSVKHTRNGTIIEWASKDEARDRILKARGAYKQSLDLTSGGEPIRPPTYIIENRANDGD